MSRTFSSEQVASTMKQRGCVLCIVKARTDDHLSDRVDAEAELWHTIVANMLSVHGIETAGAVTEGEELTWAVARRASEMAVLRCSVENKGKHAGPVTWALDTCPVVSHVGVQVSRKPRHQVCYM